MPVILFLRRLRHDVTGTSGQTGTFELDGGMADTKFFGGFFLNGGEDALALVHVHVGNAGVQAESVVVTAEGPDMHVVNFVHAGDGEDGAGHVFDAHATRSALQQNVGRFAQDSDAGPQDEKADGQSEKRVNPSGAGEMNREGTEDDGDVGERVAKIVDEDAAKIEVIAAAHQGKSDTAIYGERG